MDADTVPTLGPSSVAYYCFQLAEALRFLSGRQRTQCERTRPNLQTAVRRKERKDRERQLSTRSPERFVSILRSQQWASKTWTARFDLCLIASAIGILRNRNSIGHLVV